MCVLHMISYTPARALSPACRPCSLALGIPVRISLVTLFLSPVSALCCHLCCRFRPLPQAWVGWELARCVCGSPLFRIKKKNFLQKKKNDFGFVVFSLFYCILGVCVCINTYHTIPISGVSYIHTAFVFGLRSHTETQKRSADTQMCRMMISVCRNEVKGLHPREPWKPRKKMETKTTS